MYSDKVQKKLAAAGASIGDTISITVEGKSYEGILMPRTEMGDINCIILKLKNGYNVGILSDRVEKIAVIEKMTKKIEEPKVIGVKKSAKDKIVILGCGGTIASKIEYKTGGVFPAITPEELIASFPDLANKKFKSRILFNLFSEDFNPQIWQEIAEETAKEIKDGAKGVILMHGTDTMHYTSAALSFMLRTPVPIILVGAQRSSDRGSSDNLSNMMSAVELAESDIAEIGICMHGTSNDDFCYFHPGTKVRKMHTSRRDAFQTINRKPIAKVFWEEKKIEILGPYTTRGKQKLEIDTKLNPNVVLIYTYPGIQPEFIEKIVGMFDGIVIASTGLGQVSANLSNHPKVKALVPTIKSAIERGIPIVIAPQTIYGRINLNVYAPGRMLDEAGVIGNYCDWTPETALVKLMWVLGHTRDMKKIKSMMLTNYAGEISERSEIV
ncbi:MAG: Glu-tRNA(Gln) amidotransferase subunit GatD [Candidatus Micrarchaeia archaeon]